jgi:DNA recombination protein RmuC
MFLPTESALQQIRAIDPTFMERAWSQRIFPVGPTGLLNELIRAVMQISGAKQEENTKLIIEKVKDLLNGIAVLNTHANGIGKGLKSALDKYDKFAASFNSNFMSKAKNISKLGVNTNLKDIEPLQKYNITALNLKELDNDIIDNTENNDKLKLELLE